MEYKFHKFKDGIEVKEGLISGYASHFGKVDDGGDRVIAGAYTKSLKRTKDEGRKIKMLWQHDPSQPIGVWDEVKEDEKGLFVKGRIMQSVTRGAEAIALIEAGALDGLSIGYRTVKATPGEKGVRELQELELWEVSTVTFPMQKEARIEELKDYEAGNFAGLKRSVEKHMSAMGCFSDDEAKAAAAACAEKVRGLRDAPDLKAAMADFLGEIRGLRT